MHLLPAERAGARTIDGHLACDAAAAVPAAAELARRAGLFALLADPTRLTLLSCLDAVGAISVTDLATATGLREATVSQALKVLREREVVAVERDGRVRRYLLVDPHVRRLLQHP